MSASSSRSTSPATLAKPSQSTSSPSTVKTQNFVPNSSQDVSQKISSQNQNDTKTYRSKDVSVSLGSLPKNHPESSDATRPVVSDTSTQLVKSYIFQCNSCSFQTDKKSLMNKHSRVHLPLKRKAMEESSAELRGDETSESNPAHDNDEADHAEGVKSASVQETQRNLLNKPQLNLLALDKTKAYCQECEIQFSSIHTFMHHRNNYCQKYKTIEAIVPVEPKNASTVESATKVLTAKSRKNSAEFRKQVKRDLPSDEEDSGSEKDGGLAGKGAPEDNLELMRRNRIANPSLPDLARGAKSNYQPPQVSSKGSPTALEAKTIPKPEVPTAMPFNLNSQPQLAGLPYLPLPVYKLFLDQLFTQLTHSLAGQSKPPVRPNGSSNPLQDYLTGSGQQNDILLSLLKFQQLAKLLEPTGQSFGLPARSSEGGSESNDDSASGPLNLTNKNAENTESRSSSEREETFVVKTEDLVSPDAPLDLSKKSTSDRFRYPRPTSNQLKSPVPNASANHSLFMSYESQPATSRESKAAEARSSWPGLDRFESLRASKSSETYQGLSNLATDSLKSAEDEDIEEKLCFPHDIDERFLKHPLVCKTLNEAYSNLRPGKMASTRKPFFMCTACGYQGNTSRGVKQHG